MIKKKVTMVILALLIVASLFSMKIYTNYTDAGAPTEGSHYVSSELIDMPTEMGMEFRQSRCSCIW